VKHSVRICVSLATAVAGLLMWATTALAGDYYVYSCSTYGNTAPAFSDWRTAAHLDPGDACMQPAGGGGYGSLELNNNGGDVLEGYSAGWKATAPAGVGIVGAYTPTNDVLVDGNLSSDGFTAEYQWAGGTRAINCVTNCGGGGLGYANGINTSFAPSSWFGWATGCYLKSSCQATSSGGQVLGVHGVRLTAEENNAPSVVAVPGSNIWYRSGWVRGSWPATLDASDPSGVCALVTTVDGGTIASWGDPSRDTSQFVQCHGSQLPAQLDTTKYSNGQHTLLYTAGNAAGVISAPSKSVSIDNAPVTLNLTGPTDALSTAGTQYVDASAAAGPSGVASISCSVDGAPYQSYGGSAAQVPVSGLGPHQVECYAQNSAVDASGAPATSPTQTWSLTIREPTVSGISFTKVVDALRCRRVRERVRVPGRWVTVRRHHKLVRVHRRGHWRVVRATRCHARTARRNQVIWKKVRRHGKTVRIKQVKVVRVILLPHVVSKPTRHVAFGHGTTVSGWLGTASGTALAGQAVRILTAPDNGLGDFTQMGVVTTKADGSWTARLPAGPGRLVAAAYNGSTTTEPSVSFPVRLVVPAKLRLRIRPTQTRWGGTVRISGRVLGGYIPVGKFLRLRIGIAGIKQTFGVSDVRPNGSFRTTFKFAPGSGTVRYWFSVSTLREADYPYAPASSRRVTVTVGSRPS
jgi:hypothetical protein